MSAKNTNICLITGATSGIGRNAAFQLAKQGYELLLLGKNEKAGNKLASLLKMKFNVTAQFFKVDISSIYQVKLFAKDIKLKYSHIDLLINNAGARFDKPLLSNDGYELTFATNYLGHFLLTNLLMELLKSSVSARIINVSSNAHFGKNKHIPHILVKEKYNRHTIYGQSKLALVMFTHHLAKKLQKSNITVNTYDPGYVASNFARNNGIVPWIKFRVLFFLKRKLKTSEAAANDLVYLATSSELNKVTAKYFFGKNEKLPSQESYDKEACEELWLLSENLCDIRF